MTSPRPYKTCTVCLGNGLMPFVGTKCTCCNGSGILGTTDTSASVDQTREGQDGFTTPRDQEDQALIDKMPNDDKDKDEEAKKKALEEERKVWEEHDKQNKKK